MVFSERRKHLKKYGMCFWIVGLLILFYPSFVSASSYYVNDQGLELTELEYNNLKTLYSDARISTLTNEEYENLESMNLDYNSVRKSYKYVKDTYNNVTGEVVSEEITELEYNNFENIPQPISSMYETTYKRLALTVAQSSSTSAYVSFSTLWKVIPATRSYDVIGIRLSGADEVNGSQEGNQTYLLDGSYSTVHYTWNGTNINNLSNGFGISMNIVNSDIDYLECGISVIISFANTPITVFASYQHATSDISLATSKSYTLGSGGLGNVFIFTGNIENYYDCTPGVYDGF